MSGHTPGPWQTYGTMVYAPGEHGGNICEVSDPRATSTVGHTPLRLGSADAAEAFANAELIARAPDLLHENEKLKQQIMLNWSYSNDYGVFCNFCSERAAGSERPEGWHPRPEQVAHAADCIVRTILTQAIIRNLPGE